MKDLLKIVGFARVYHRGREICVENLIVTTGFNLAAKRLVGVAADALTYIGMGTSGTAPAIGQTALIGTEHLRVAATPSVAGATASLSATLTATAVVTIREFGTFNDPAAGVMFSRFTTQAFEMAIGDPVTVDWQITFT